ncbi:L-threonylcarbamoyladenylate synthase [Gemella sp. zg-1178]|uniref:L-threonylcarbamoyladenylate synthase n=1 Tax=Gemella sp. zg-1178 TaxID=2840372 RepID=UPI001C050143|nr:L-threonylcarbamoyladenylate synthase [Gemella sp. zg-1178]MBU0278021.1 threonylcarbamoyl-AMP synthase [Gemella sp. zg-1178]
MKTEIIDLRNNSDEEIFKKLQEYYLDNKLIAIPTETVYGLSADASSEDAVKKIYLAKGRPSDNPLIVHFYKISQVSPIVEIDNAYVKKLIDNFWPGPMTLILALKNKNLISKSVRAGLDTLAIRMPNDNIARKILKHTKLLLAAPSANISGKPSPTKFEHVYNDLNNKIDVIIKGNDSHIGLESTVIDCTKFPFVVARPGSITLKDIEKLLGEGNIVYNKENNMEKPASPGMKYRHYSTNGDLIIVDEKLENILEKLRLKNNKFALITYKKYKNLLKDTPFKVKYLAEDEENIEEANKNLYNILRECDIENIEEIYILKLKETDKNKALLNRINKASSKK